jgi:hypothetical protein
MRRVRWSWLACAVAVALAIPACGGDGKVRVNGVLTLDGKPVEGAIVSFVPVAKDNGNIATATTDKDGNFSLSTTKPDDGAFPGEYKVTVVYAEGPQAPPAQGMKEAFTAKKEKPKNPPKYIIPAKYRDAAKTDLTQQVPTGGTVKLDLKSGT